MRTGNTYLKLLYAVSTAPNYCNTTLNTTPYFGSYGVNRYNISQN